MAVDFSCYSSTSDASTSLRLSRRWWQGTVQSNKFCSLGYLNVACSVWRGGFLKKKANSDLTFRKVVLLVLVSEARVLAVQPRTVI